MSFLNPKPKNKKRASQKKVPAQISFIAFALVACLCLPFVQILVVKIPKSSEAQEQAIKQTYEMKAVVAKRGDILDRNRKPMATSDNTLSVSTKKQLVDEAISKDQQRYENDVAKAVKEEQSIQNVKPALTLEKWAEDTAKLLAINGIAGQPTLTPLEIQDKYRKAEKAVHLTNNVASSWPDMLRKSSLNHGVFETDTIPQRRYTEKMSARQLLGSAHTVTRYLEEDAARKDRAAARKNQGRYTTLEGREGLEYKYDEQLSGKDGKQYLKALSQVFKPDSSSDIPQPIPVVNGKNLVLTIDRRIQYRTEQILDEAIKELNAKSASAVVMDVKSGDLLAVANLPMVEVDDHQKSHENMRKNRAFTDAVEPGSINKIVTVAGALNEGLVTPDKIFQVPYEMTIGEETYHDSESHPTTDMTVSEILAESSNIGTIKIAQLLGKEGLADYLTRFGFKRKTPVGWPAETAGLLKPVSEWNSSSLPTIAFGQGIATSLVQSAQMTSIIANDGILAPPRLVLGFTDENNVFYPEPSVPQSRVISSETASQVTTMLEEVVESNHGTGKNARVEGYRIAGKTGTAQKVNHQEGGYYKDKYWATFVGFAPAENPEIVIAIRIEEPTPYYSSKSAAPTFSRVMQQALFFRQVQPTEPFTPQPASSPEAVVPSTEEKENEDEEQEETENEN